MFRPHPLHVVRPDPGEPRASTPGGGDRGDLAVMAMLFGVNLVPLVGEAVTRWRWGAGTLGLATAGALVTGRELVLGVLPRLRSGGWARSLPRRRR